jgi:hypothetical protein
MSGKTLLSEEILNEILGNVSKIYDIKIVNNYVIWNNGYVNEINIYELMHLAKEKLSATGAYVSSYIDFGSELWFCQYKDIDSDGVVYSKVFNDEFEYNAVFKALHWYMQDR